MELEVEEVQISYDQLDQYTGGSIHVLMMPHKNESQE